MSPLATFLFFLRSHQIHIKQKEILSSKPILRRQDKTYLSPPATMLKALQNSDLLVFVGDVLCSVGLSETLATSNFSFHHLIFKQLATNSLFDIFDAVYIGPLILLSTRRIGTSVGEFQISLILKIFCRKTQVQREFCIVYHIFNIF